MSSGILILAGTTLGPASDVPLRSLGALRSSDLVVFEEDRMARFFLKTAGLHRPYLKLSEHREKATLAEVGEALRAGRSVAYMSDQGMPGVADPGRDLVELAFRLGARVQVVPGPSALTAALAASPFDVSRFRFLGLLPRDGARRLEALRGADRPGEALVVLDTPYRSAAVLQDCATALGETRLALLALDISGEKELFLCDSLGRLAARPELAQKLNFTLVISGRAPGSSRGGSTGSRASRRETGSGRSPSGFRRGR